MYKKISFFSFIIVFFVSINSFAGNNDWKLYKSVEGVNIYSKTIPCTANANPNFSDPNREYCILKFENTTSRKISVNWIFDVWYGEDCRTCSMENKTDYTHAITLNANETIEGKCSDEKSSGLTLFSGFQKKESGKTLSKFEMNQLQIKPIK